MSHAAHLLITCSDFFSRHSLPLCITLSGPRSLFFFHIHRDAIERFGRFPSRNKYLGRENTEEENKALDEGTVFGSKGYFAAANREWIAANPEYAFAFWKKVPGEDGKETYKNSETGEEQAEPPSAPDGTVYQLS